MSSFRETVALTHRGALDALSAAVTKAAAGRSATSPVSTLVSFTLPLSNPVTLV